MRLYRNKAAHLGSSVFRQIGLHDNSGQFYTFIPRQWPYIWERYMKPAGTPAADPSVADLFRETLVHQDLLSYVSGARRKVVVVTATAVAILAAVYRQFGTFDANQAALTELDGSSETYRFDSFAES